MALRSLCSSIVGNLGLKSSASLIFESANPYAFALHSYATVAKGIRYAKSHEWAKLDGDVATIGISDHAQNELGDVVYVELPEVGTALKVKQTFGVVESVKAASDVYAPIAGEVTAVNSDLAANTATVNKSPFEDGWLIKVKVSDKKEYESLMDADEYAKFCEH